MKRDLSPACRRVLDALIEGGEQSTAEIATALRVHQTTVSRDMRVLVQAGLAETSGRRVNTYLYRAIELADGPSKPVAPARCTCGDLVTRHERNGKGMRARCTACTTCRLFVSAQAVARA